MRKKDFSFQRPGFGKITMPGSSSAGGILSGSTVTGGEPERMAAAADGRKNVKKSYIMEEKRGGFTMLSLMPRTNYGLNSFFDNHFDHFFDNMFSDPFFRTGSRAQMPSMKTDVKEKDGMYTLEMDLPGYEKSDIKAELNNGYLTISASKDSGEQEKKDEESGYVCRERYTGQCSRSFYVGDSVKEEDIKAGYNNGILTLTFPKEAPAEIPEKKYIAIE